mmetsp:Transcript_2769/g.5730  ORF Transcript_2769/g.5730 Transcript_2769/m.5730 type:complete len:89 (+) Transcript_2769:420-686(+)
MSRRNDVSQIRNRQWEVAKTKRSRETGIRYGLAGSFCAFMHDRQKQKGQTVYRRCVRESLERERKTEGIKQKERMVPATSLQLRLNFD